MVKRRENGKTVKEDVFISGFELNVDLFNGYIFVECPDDKRGFYFPKTDSVYQIFTAA